jgi:hypothetical protein
MHAQQRSYTQRNHQDLWDKFWKDKDGNVVIFQMPNFILITWVVLTIISLFVPRGHVQETIWWASTITLAVWSLVEMLKGVNYFRRTLGLVVLLITIASAFGLGR